MQDETTDVTRVNTDAVTIRLEALELKVALLEQGRRTDKVRRIWMGGLCAALGLTVIGVTAKAAPQATTAPAANTIKPNVITCTGLTILGLDGKPRVEIGDNDADVGYLVTEDKAGNVVNKVSSDSTGKGDIQVMGGDGKPRVEFGANNLGSGYVLTTGTNGGGRVRLSSDTGDNGSLDIMGTDGKDRVFTGVNTTGSGYFISEGTNGNVRYRISTDNADKGSIEVMGTDGKTRVFEDINATDSGQIETLGADGNLRSQITADSTDAGVLHVLGQNGKDRVVLSSDAKTGVGVAQFDDATGTVKKTLP